MYGSIDRAVLCCVVLGCAVLGCAVLDRTMLDRTMLDRAVYGCAVLGCVIDCVVTPVSFGAYFKSDTYLSLFTELGEIIA